MDKIRTLVYDIEVLPNKGYFFELRDKYGSISKDFVKVNKSICTVAYKFVGEKERGVISVGDWRKDYKANPWNDKNLIEEFAKILSKADRVVAHYGDKFDQPFLNARALYNGLAPLQFPKSIDTYKLAKKHFKLMANRLGYIGEFLGLGDKLPMEAMDWVKVAEGDLGALKKMAEYNMQDVDLLEAVYLKMLPYVITNLDLNKLSSKAGEGNVCACCGSRNLNKAGKRVLTSKICQAFKCIDCGHYFYDQNVPYVKN